jgi:hypothetical protein
VVLWKAPGLQLTQAKQLFFAPRQQLSLSDDKPQQGWLGTAMTHTINHMEFTASTEPKLRNAPVSV